MSIDATLWRLKFPSGGDDHTGCAWVEVIAQGVPAQTPHPQPPLALSGQDYLSCSLERPANRCCQTP